MSKEIGGKRRRSREQAFIILFEQCFNECDTQELIELASELHDFESTPFMNDLINGVNNNLDNINSVITNNIKGWTIDRISKVTLSLLRLATYEILYSEDVPVNVAINEAVELSKKYSTEKDAAFLNGILGSVAKSKEQ